MKIIFKYGTMSSGKSLDMLKVVYNYKEKGIFPCVAKHIMDKRVENKVFSRTGISEPAIEINMDNIDELFKNNPSVILIDESQFFTKEEIDYIIDKSYDLNINAIFFYGLKTNFKGELFEGSKRIIERCDTMEESTSICWCGKKSRQNARIINGKIVKDGEDIIIDDKDSNVEYLPLCNYHFYKNEIKKNILDKEKGEN